ncbi:hypothetical protein DEU56DRAFT_771883 [Suillus clintonianus]|uniref:uncharacterized protein n=1 Tax=Suillus clintonianus TaxID=1904413 RepID=UPI001B87987F|nr:uncharacterized protein DEU56DRAFT_771883 [Suillus clintonianus]KAG2153925.1 hypothetical protein DEU56DRAFT_771883 [Suillus clintonianus]
MLLISHATRCHDLMELVLGRNLCGPFCVSMQCVVPTDPATTFEEAIPVMLLCRVRPSNCHADIYINEEDRLCYGVRGTSPCPGTNRRNGELSLALVTR